MTGPARVLTVRIVAVHVECRRCGQFGRLQHDHPDAFTQQVLQPLASFWTSHRDPKLVLLEWVAVADSPHLTDERPST